MLALLLAAATVFTAFLDALNTKDEAKLRAFVEAHASQDVPIDARVARMKALAERGAPFKLLRITDDKPGELRGVIEDKEGQQLGFVAALTPDGRFQGMRLTPADQRPAKDYVFQSVQQLAAEIAKDSESPAMTLAVIHDGQLEQAAVGVRELGKPEPVTVDEPFSIGSIGKSICGTVIGKLIESGKLRWDTTLREALPGAAMRPGYERVTLEQIMHHRGGIPEDGGFTRDRIHAIIGDATEPQEIRARYVADILSRAPIAKPGATFAYSNAGYALLSRVAELASKKPYEQLVRELVFAPLGLSHSSIGGIPPGAPSGHIPSPSGLRPVQMRGPLESMFAGAGGGIWMSAADLARYGEAHLAGLNGKDGFLEAATIQRLHRGEPEDGPEPRSYACDWSIRKLPGLATLHGHNGSNGTFRAELAIFPEAKLVIAAIVNRGGESDPSPGLSAVLAVARKLAPERTAPAPR